MSNPIMQALMQLFQQGGNGAPQSDPNQPSGNGAQTIDPAKIAAFASRNGGSQGQTSSPAATAFTPPDAMNMGMSLMNNPMAQGVPQPSPAAGLMQHPVMQKIIQSIASALQTAGFVGASPQNRFERQQMDLQKSEAIARMAQEQQALSQGQQRIGIEGQRATQEGAYQAGQLAQGVERNKTEALRAKQEGTYQGGMLGVSQTNSLTEAARQKAEAEYQKSSLKQQADTLEETIRQHHAQNAIEQNRVGLEGEANKIAAQRVQMEENHFDKQTQIAGQQVTRQMREDERKSLHQSLDEFYKANSWTGYLTGKDSILAQHQAIDKYIDNTIQSPAGGGTPTTGTNGGPPTTGGTKPAKWDGTKWTDARTGGPI